MASNLVLYTRLPLGDITRLTRSRHRTRSFLSHGRRVLTTKGVHYAQHPASDHWFLFILIALESL